MAATVQTNVWDTFGRNFGQAAGSGLMGSAGGSGSVTTDFNGTQTTESMDQQSQMLMRLLLSAQLRNASIQQKQAEKQYSKEAAIKDSQGLVNNIRRELTQTQLPQLYNQEGASGVFNSSATLQGAQNAIAGAAQKSTEAVNNVTASYANILQSVSDTNTQNILKTLQLAQGVNTKNVASGIRKDITQQDPSGIAGVFGGISNFIGKLF